MIDIALKHWIYEVCIDQVFSGIEKNFVPAKEDEVWKQLRHNEHYHWLDAYRQYPEENARFFNVFIMSVTKTTVHIMYESEPDKRKPAFIPKELIVGVGLR